MIAQKNFTIVDVETTGGSAARGKIIEIGILRIQSGEIASKYKTFVNPGMQLPDFITQLTGIEDKHLKKAPHFSEIAEELLAFFEDSIFVAHNSSFDYKFLKTEFERAGFAFNMESLCTVRLSRVLYPQFKRHNLSALIDRFAFTCKNRHRAYDDAKVVWDFMRLVHKTFPQQELEVALQRTIKKLSPKKQQKLFSNQPVELEYVDEAA